ncbi:hypothetical protein ACWN8B_00165 [Vagococcus zengguangii]|nr:hypothetical protein [Vagococcus zengguangii]
MPNYRDNGINIDSTYFIKNPYVNPADFLISYFDKEPYKLSILYYNQGNYKQSYYEKLKDITYNLWASLEKTRAGDEMTYIGTHGWYISTGDAQSIPVHSIYNQLSIPTDELELFLHTFYHEFDKEMISNRPEMTKPLSKLAYISFEQYKQIMRLMSEGDIPTMDELFKELSAGIREKNGYSRNEATRAHYWDGRWIDDETYQQDLAPKELPGLDELVENVLGVLPGGDIYWGNEDDFDTTKVEVICKVVESFEKEEIQKVIDYLQGLI